MAKLNMNIYLNCYEDEASSNNPSLNNFRWFRQLSGLAADRPVSLSFTLAPGESRTLFDGTRSLLQDNTTQYQLLLKSGNTYVLKHVGGTAPQFRTARMIGSDATTQVTVNSNNGVLTFASTGGTLFSLIAGGVIVGDEVFLGSQFAAGNRGRFKVIATTATSFTVENSSGVAEGPVTLGADFADQIRVYSTSGVQVGDTLRIFGGFSAASQSAYDVTAVQDDLVEFFSAKALPLEVIVTDQVAAYSAAKVVVYLETSKPLDVQTNGSESNKLSPIIRETSIVPGQLLRSDIIWSMSVENNGIEPANVFFASVE